MEATKNDLLFYFQKTEICNAPKPKYPSLNAYKTKTCSFYFFFQNEKEKQTTNKCMQKMENKEIELLPYVDKTDPKLP